MARALRWLAAIVAGLFLLLSLTVVGLLWFDRQVRVAELDSGEQVTMTLRPIFGTRNEWHRWIAVRSDEGHSGWQLMPDTGWWRGSNLFRMPGGALVLVEGQDGCHVLAGQPDAGWNCADQGSWT